MSVYVTVHLFNDITTTSTLSLQAVAHAAHLGAASARLGACAKERHVTPAAVSEESAASAPYFFNVSDMLMLQLLFCCLKMSFVIVATCN